MEITIGLWVVPSLITVVLWLANRPESGGWFPDAITPLLNTVGTLIVWCIYFALT